METKWYSDIWQLIVAPFKRGIPQIVRVLCYSSFGIGGIRIFKYSTYFFEYDICG
ncbi:MAG: hypothetical protein E6Z78_03725 [Veillonella sp.]|nr:hypothetical protein [Veillonella sp.]